MLKISASSVYPRSSPGESLFDPEVGCQHTQTGATGAPTQFGLLCLNEPFELPSEFMFWLFPRRIAGFKEGNFQITSGSGR